jgi:hypothetical protein
MEREFCLDLKDCDCELDHLVKLEHLFRLILERKKQKESITRFRIHSDDKRFKERKQRKEQNSDIIQ